LENSGESGESGESGDIFLKVFHGRVGIKIVCENCHFFHHFTTFSPIQTYGSINLSLTNNPKKNTNLLE
jgi:hypothetical protein